GGGRAGATWEVIKQGGHPHRSQADQGREHSADRLRLRDELRALLTRRRWRACKVHPGLPSRPPRLARQERRAWGHWSRGRPVEYDHRRSRRPGPCRAQGREAGDAVSRDVGTPRIPRRSSMSQTNGVPTFEMTVDLNVLDHLGINLYSNIAAVLTEAVAN